MFEISDSNNIVIPKGTNITCGYKNHIICTTVDDIYKNDYLNYSEKIGLHPLQWMMGLTCLICNSNYYCPDRHILHINDEWIEIND